MSVMKHISVLFVLIMILNNNNFVLAQNQLSCGDFITANIAPDEMHKYLINVESNIKLIIHAEQVGNYSQIYFRYLRLYAPNGKQIEFDNSHRFARIITQEIQKHGIYTLELHNSSNYRGGDYNLYLSCIDEFGELTSHENNRFVHALQCGSILDNEISYDETHIYFIHMIHNSTLNIFVEQVGSYSEIYFRFLSLYDPNGSELENDNSYYSAKIETQPLNETGNYLISVHNSPNAAGGSYRIMIGCITDGKSVRPGDV